MGNFIAIYKMLKILELSLDLKESSIESLSKDGLGLSEARWCRLMAMLVSAGYITGVQVWDGSERGYPRVYMVRPEITLKGLEYLQENPLMKKAANIAK